MKTRSLLPPSSFILLTCLLLLFLSSPARASNVEVMGNPRTPTITSVSTSGTVAAGAMKVTFIFSASFTGSILGCAYSGTTDGSQTIDAPLHDTLTAIPYVVSAGSIRIVVVK